MNFDQIKASLNLQNLKRNNKSYKDSTIGFGCFRMGCSYD